MRQRNLNEFGAAVILYLCALLAFALCLFSFAAQARVSCIPKQRSSYPVIERFDCYVNRPRSGSATVRVKR